MGKTEVTSNLVLRGYSQQKCEKSSTKMMLYPWPVKEGTSAGPRGLSV